MKIAVCMQLKNSWASKRGNFSYFSMMPYYSSSGEKNLKTVNGKSAKEKGLWIHYPVVQTNEKQSPVRTLPVGFRIFTPRSILGTFPKQFHRPSGVSFVLDLLLSSLLNYCRL